MEWLGILLLYLVSGFIKKRQQNAKRRQIESDPEWDSEKNYSENTTDLSNPLDKLLNDLFEENPKTPEVHPKVRDVVKNINVKSISKNKKDEVVEKPSSGETGLSSIDEEIEDFKEKVYHSKISDRDEQHYGIKWRKKINIRHELFSSKDSLKKSIITKEILDKPLSLRK